jgi:hypothetical protein
MASLAEWAPLLVVGGCAIGAYLFYVLCGE